MKKAVFFLLVISSFRVASQPAFTLPDVNKMILDPAFTGIDTSYKNEAALSTKIVLNNPFYPPLYLNAQGNSYTIGTYQMRLNKIKSGIGIMLNYNNYNIGNITCNQTAAKLYYRYTILPGLSVGADAGFVNLKATYNSSEDEPFLGEELLIYTPPMQGTINSLTFDGGLGILYQFKSVYAGFSVDHITSPKATYPEYSYENGLVNVGSAMLNYSGIAYNWIVGGHIGSENGGLDLSASYRDFNLNMNTSFVLPHFFIGFSVLLGNYYNENVIPETYTSENVYLALMGGIKAYHKKIKISFAYAFSGSNGVGFPAPLEGELSYSF